MPYGTSESIDETEADSQTKNRLVVAKEEGRGGERWTGTLRLADANYYL